MDRQHADAVPRPAAPALNAAPYDATRTLVQRRNAADPGAAAQRPCLDAGRGRAGQQGKAVLAVLHDNRSFSESEIEFFLNVDFISHIALAAVLCEGRRQLIVGGARYIVTRPGELAFAIDDLRVGRRAYIEYRVDEDRDALWTTRRWSGSSLGT